jgi:hypothetical protein
MIYAPAVLDYERSHAGGQDDPERFKRYRPPFLVSLYEENARGRGGRFETGVQKKIDLGQGTFGQGDRVCRAQTLFFGIKGD